MRNFFLIGWTTFLFSCSSINEKNTTIENVKEPVVTTAKEKHLVKYKLPELPDELFFAGEKIPLEKEEVRNKLMRELIIHSNRHSKTLIMLKEINYWEDYIKQILTKNNVSEDFFYLAIAESELDNNIESPAKAMGMWQLMEATAKEYGLIINKEIDERRNPEKATKAACDYLKEAKSKFGSWSSAAASYNRGMNGLRNALMEQKVESIYDLYLNRETSRYMYRILSLKLILENPLKYGFDVKEIETNRPVSFEKVLLPKGEYNTVDLAKQNNVTFAELKKYNPWLVDVKSYKLKNDFDSLFICLPK